MRRRGGSDGQEPPTVVTSAARSHSDDIDLRERRYLRTQLVRVVCVILGVLLPVPTGVKLLFFAGAVALPWFGVVMANAGPVVSRDRPVPVPVVAPVPLASLEPGRVIDADERPGRLEEPRRGAAS